MHYASPLGIYHDGIVYVRHETLQLNLRNPSPAMQAWILEDHYWRLDQDYITVGGGDLVDATAYADQQFLRRRELYG